MTEINKLGLVFNDGGLYADLISELLQVVENTAMYLQKMFQSDADNRIDGDWTIDIFFEEGDRQIRAIVGNDHWYAFIDNYGKGSMMDKDNPWLAEYIRSAYFNPNRIPTNGYAIMTRPLGEYLTPDWKSGHGDRINVGGSENVRNLEATDNPLYRPYPPKHWLEKNMAAIKEIFHDLLEDTIRHFDFSKYLKGGI